MTITGEDEQQPLWGRQTPGMEALYEALDENRQAWLEARLLYAVGSPEEQERWDAFRAASDRVWEVLHGT